MAIFTKKETNINNSEKNDDSESDSRDQDVKDDNEIIDPKVDIYCLVPLKGNLAQAEYIRRELEKLSKLINKL